MAEALVDRIDRTIDQLLARKDASAALQDSSLAALARIAGELRMCPRASFRTRLRADLERRTTMSTVLETASVREAFERRGIVKLKADWTNADPAITKMLKQFGRPGVPLYVLYPAGKSAEPIVLPELLTKNIVLEHLENIAPRVAAAK